MTTQILIAGFGGQGILFSGKFLAYEGLIEDKNVSWLPSYSPIIDKPDVLVAMNLPSLDKYEDSTIENGHIFVDSSLISREVKRTDVNVHYIPATKMASDEGLTGLANMILVGYIIKKTGVISIENLEAGLKKVVSARKQDLFDLNKKAIELGFNYEK